MGWKKYDVAQCRRCKLPMVEIERVPLLFSELDTATFKCEKCGDTQKRQMKRPDPR